MDFEQIITAYNGLRHRVRDLESEYAKLSELLANLQSDVVALQQPLVDPAHARSPD